MHLPRFRPTRRPAIVIGAVIAVGALALGASAVAGRGADAGNYRTATVSEQQVDQILRSVGSVEPVSQASVAFPVGGTVSSVDVEIGDSVTLGQSLASLEVDDLTTSLHSAEAALAQAELSLELALAGEDPGTTTGGAPAGGFGQAASTGSNAELRAAQEAVLEAQQDVDAAMSTAEAALANATQVCAETETPTTPDDDPTTSADSEVCQAALEASLEAQRQLTTAQQQLIQASDDLTALLEEMASQEPETPGSIPDGPGQPPDQSGAPSGGSSGMPSGEPAAEVGATSSPSAEDLIAYQKAVDAAALDVVVAEHAIEQSTIVSPIEGTVASVGIAAGDSVTAGSATQAVVIVSDGGFEVTTSISVTDLPDVAVGHAAEVVPDGATKPISGQVVRIGVAPESSGNTYALTIGLDGDTSSLGNGSVASVAIVTESAETGLAVPTSAVTRNGDQATVRRIVDGTATETDVEVGPIGDRWIAITDGLEEGDTVVIADLDEPLPGSATDTSSSSGNTGSGGFPGGGAGFPGGFRPAG